MKWTPPLLIVVLAGCDPTPPPQAERQPNPVFETQIRAVDKARAVEGQVMDAARAQREQIDAAEH